MEPIKAKFAGVCARTGKRYAAGDLIVKLASGKWALAQTRAGAIKVAPDWRLARMPDGEEKQIPLHLPTYCRACVEADGKTPSQLPDSERALYEMTRQGDAIICSRCGRTIEIISQAEMDARKAAAAAEREAAYRLEMEQNLHLEPAGYGLWRLSHRIPREMWDSVQEYFVYWSADDLDEFDFFDMPGGYYLRPGAAPEGVLLNSPAGTESSTADAVEEILHIRPENRLAVLIPKWEREAAEAKIVAARRKAFEESYYNLFSRADDGEYLDCDGKPFQRGAKPCELPAGEWLDWRVGSSLYGTAYRLLIEGSGAHVWHVSQNGADGDDWGRDNCRAGIGIRYPLTPERQAFLDELRRIQQAKKEVE
jgi:hypothetical protein